MWCATMQTDFTEIRNLLYDAAMEGRHGLPMANWHEQEKYYRRLIISGVPRPRAIEQTIEHCPPVVYPSAAFARVVQEARPRLGMREKGFFRLAKVILERDEKGRFHREAEGGYSINGWASQEHLRTLHAKWDNTPRSRWATEKSKYSVEQVEEVRVMALELSMSCAETVPKEEILHTLAEVTGYSRTTVWEMLNGKARFRRMGRFLQGERT